MEWEIVVMAAMIAVFVITDGIITQLRRSAMEIITNLNHLAKIVHEARKWSLNSAFILNIAPPNCETLSKAFDSGRYPSSKVVESASQPRPDRS